MKSEYYRGREQTEVKHRALERYLSGFAPIVGRWVDEIVYVDCCAGPWESVAPGLEDTSFSRALNVLRTTRDLLKQEGHSPRLRCLLVEREPEPFRRLSAFCNSVKDIEVLPRRWDFTRRVDDVLAYVGGSDRTFPFFFIDPTGWEPVAIPVIRPVLARQPVEVLVNLMTSWIVWLVGDPSKGLAEVLGGDVSPVLGLSGDEREEAIVRLYCESFRRVGSFPYVCTLPVMKAEQDAMHYYLVYGTRNPKGVEVFKNTEKAVASFMHETRAESQRRREVERTGQDGLFTADATYIERRYSRLRRRNIDDAKSLVADTLGQSSTVPYDDIWAAAMQFAAVAEEDLRDWLADWESQGLVEWSERLPRQRVPQRGKGNVFKWKR